MDARIRYTKMIIKKHFMNLLKKQPVNKITVKNICDLAEINRATFYKYYLDCFDLLDQIENDMIAELKHLIAECHNKSITIIFKQIFTRIKNESDIYITLASENGDPRFPARILKLCYSQITPSFESQFSHIPTPKREWLYYYLANGCGGVLSYWIANGMQEDVGELSTFIGDLSNKILR